MPFPRYINPAKEKDQPKSVPLKIFTEDIKNSACSVTVTMTNSDTMNDVINMSLSKLRITGSEKDHQLWISSGEKKASYSLTDSKKTTVSKSPVKNWAFWCSSRTRKDNQHPPLRHTKPKELFGVPLEDVCENDTLPTPILEMLSYITLKGPFTKGIFRQSASTNSCRALKEKLNSGHKVNLNEESVLVVASTLKEFLRNIQGGIFSAGLCDKWLDVMDRGNEEEKITETQRLLDQLPRANVVFLRYLFGALHTIEQHSSSNQMTAYNLSVCLTPSILCLPDSGCSAFKNLTKKISFIEFLVQKSLKIFGVEITSLFGDNSVSCDHSDITDNSGKVAVTTEKSLESKPVRVTSFYKRVQLQYDAITSSRMGPSTGLSTVF